MKRWQGVLPRVGDILALVLDGGTALAIIPDEIPGKRTPTNSLILPLLTAG